MLRSCVFAAVLLASPVAAQVPLSDAELTEQVGGLRTPSGLEFNFGAMVNTYVDGKLALQSRLTYTDQGVVRDTTGGALPADLGGISVDGTVPGFYLPGENGGTVLLHDLGDGRIGSVVLNTADNRDIRQETVINLNIPQLAQYQKDVAGQQLDMRLQAQVQQALQGATR